MKWEVELPEFFDRTNTGCRRSYLGTEIEITFFDGSKAIILTNKDIRFGDRMDKFLKSLSVGTTRPNTRVTARTVKWFGSRTFIMGKVPHSIYTYWEAMDGSRS